jgi:hypothetical protein
MSAEVKPLVEINQQAISLLLRELGVADTVRFLKQFTPGLGDYTQEREALFANQTLEQITDEIERTVSRVVQSAQHRSSTGHSLAL